MKELSTDIAVIAGGPSGLCAAASAAEGGASVVLFEKSSTVGGAANMGMGPLGLGSRLQRSQMIDITPDKAFAMIMDYTHWRVDARIVRKYFDLSGDTINWLENMGVEFYGAKPYFSDSESTWHIVNTPNGIPGARAASNMTKTIAEYAKELGVEILTETPVCEILTQDGKICGVKAHDKNGEEIICHSKAVCICTGGFGDNPEMIKEETGYDWGKDFFSFRVPGVVGEGMKMAWAVGAGRSDINVEMVVNMPAVGDYPDLKRAFFQPSLMVNLKGKRFFNEELMGNSTYAGNAVNIQPGRCGFVILDKAIVREYQRNGVDFISFVSPNADIGRFDEYIDAALAANDPCVFKADTLEELAEMAGIDKEGFLETIEEYNHMCETSDTYFNKRRDYMRPIRKGPFYAGKMYPGAYGSLGGIKVNENMEVLTDNWDVIPGLYAAGTDTCTIYGDSYCFKLPGNTMGYAVNSGRIAGESASEFIFQQC